MLVVTTDSVPGQRVREVTPMGANAVIMMRFDSSEIASFMSEIVAYGTAVVLEPAT
jgi:uncharacterized protein YbjQ (UPF0145 family)